MKLFRRLRRRLAKELPPCLPTRVYRRPFAKIGRDAITITNKSHTGWIITIASELEEVDASECLAHEWAHAVADIRGNPHGPAWGKAHARAWTIFDGMLP